MCLLYVYLCWTSFFFFFCCFLILNSVRCSLFHPVIIAQLCSWGRKTREPDISDLLLLPFYFPSKHYFEPLFINWCGTVQMFVSTGSYFDAAAHHKDKELPAND